MVYKDLVKVEFLENMFSKNSHHMKISELFQIRVIVGAKYHLWSHRTFKMAFQILYNFVQVDYQISIISPNNALDIEKVCGEYGLKVIVIDKHTSNKDRFLILLTKTSEDMMILKLAVGF